MLTEMLAVTMSSEHMCVRLSCDVGDWRIKILYEGQHVDGSPFTVKVYDPGQVRVSGQSSGVVGAAVHFASKHISTLSTLTL